MKAAIVTSFPRDPEWPHGGVEAVSVNLVRALASRGDVDVHVVTFDIAPRAPPTPEAGDGPATQSPSAPLGKSSITTWKGATIHRLPARMSSLLAYALGPGRRQIHSYLADLKPDVVHAHDFYGITVKRLPIPRVFTVHGFIHEDTRFAPSPFARIRSWLWKWAETSAWADQPHIIAISPYVRERLRGVAKGVIHDIENPISEEFFRIERHPVPGTVFSAALLCPRKNTLGLLAAAARLVQSGVPVRFRLAGQAVDPAYRLRILDYINEHHLNACVSLLGPLRTTEVRKELAEACAFVLLSFEEGAPMGVAEAMAAGVPVVASNRCGMPYMIQNAETGFLVQPDVLQDTALHLERILNDAALAARFAANARDFAFARFHPARVAERTRDVYELAIGSIPADKNIIPHL